MSFPSSPGSAYFVAGIITPCFDLFSSVYKDMEKIWGKGLLISSWMKFFHTEYYSEEMGEKLFRRLILFETPVDQEDYWKIKHEAWNLEKKYSINNKRRINIDPGFLTLEKFILLTGKNYSHRIYLGKGVFADLTLIYLNGGFKSFDWTYSDYKTKEIICFLTKARNYITFLNSKPMIMKERQQNDK